MKRILVIMVLMTTNHVFSQVSIGKEAVENNSVSLDFGTDNRGIILPWVTSISSISSAVDGTLVYDSSDKKVKYLQNGSWFDLSVDETGVVNLSEQENLVEQENAKLAIGINADQDNTTGVLVLTDNNKAMILPKVNSPHLNIISPDPGMIVYDTNSKQLAVFNGTVWSFWKPK